jgi:uncharacterized protein YxeA
MKKNSILIIILVLIVSVPIVIYLFSENNVKAEVERVDKLLKELQKEQGLVAQERLRLDQKQRNLTAFETELNKKHDEYLARKADLEQKEKVFNEKVEGRMVDRQTIETYENIDPEQAAVLIKNLYLRDSKLATLIMRKIAGKRAGKILEAMIPIDKETSTRLAEETLNFYRPE